MFDAIRRARRDKADSICRHVERESMQVARQFACPWIGTEEIHLIPRRTQREATAADIKIGFGKSTALSRRQIPGGDSILFRIVQTVAQIPPGYIHASGSQIRNLDKVQLRQIGMREG